MQVMLGKVMTDLDGKELKGSNEQPFTLRTACMEALLAQSEDEKHLSGEEKLKRWELAVKVKNASDPADLTSDDVSLIKKLIGKVYAPLVVGQAWTILEGK